VKTSTVEIIEENAILPCGDTNGDSADEIPASLNFHEAIRKDKSSSSFASKKSLFNDTVPDSLPESTAKGTVPKRKSTRIESKVVDAPTTKRSRHSVQIPVLLTVVEQTPRSETESYFPRPHSNKVTTKINGRRRSAATTTAVAIEDKCVPNVANSTAAECESQSLFVSKILPKTLSILTRPPSSSSVSVENKSTRRKSLKSRNASVEPLRSPINTRKRRSAALTDASGASASKKLSPLDIDDSCSETDERVMKQEKCEKSNKDESRASNGENSPSSSSMVTVVAANSSSSQMNDDSVVIVEEDPEVQVITIDSECSQATGEQANVSVTDVFEVTEEQSTAIVAEEEATFVENTQVECVAPEHDAVSIEDSDRSVAESIKSTQSSFNLALSDSNACDQQANVTMNVQEKPDALETNGQQLCSEQNHIVGSESASTDKADGEIVGLEKGDDGKEVAPSEADYVSSTPEDVNTNASPLSGNSRALQMLQMVYNGTQNLSKSRTRFKSNTRSPNVNTSLSPATSRTMVNGMSVRSAVSSRNMKMLQVNGHGENITRPSPSKMWVKCSA